MPFSADEGKFLFKDFIKSFQPQTILDVGAGAGDYEKRLREVEREFSFLKPARIDAVEIFQPYIDRFNLRSRYSSVYNENIMDFSNTMGDYDLIILGDVVEHIEKVDMVILWNQFKLKSKWIWISIPMLRTPLFNFYCGYDQGSHEWQENINEKHVSNWEYNEIHGMLGPFVWSVPFRIICVFLAQGRI